MNMKHLEDPEIFINTLYKLDRRFNEDFNMKILDFPTNNTNFKNQSKPAWDCSIETNMTSVFFLIQALHVLMKKSKSASIVNISSMYGEYAPDKNIYKGTKINNPAAYSVAKAGLNHMTKWLAVELGPKIRVNAISPGGLFRNQDKMFVKKYAEKTLLKRI